MLQDDRRLDEPRAGLALIYCRGATMYSIWAQQEVCEERCSADGYGVGRVVVDLGSGRVLTGPKLDTVRELLRGGQFAALIASAPAILTADPDLLDALHEDCRRVGAALIFVHDDNGAT